MENVVHKTILKNRIIKIIGFSAVFFIMTNILTLLTMEIGNLIPIFINILLSFVIGMFGIASFIFDKKWHELKIITIYTITLVGIANTIIWIYFLSGIE